MTKISDFIAKLKSCPPGLNGWKMFEDICIEILIFLLVPPLEMPRIQPRTHSGIDRRDAIFPNRNFDLENTWGKIHQELNARLILFEFKNYDKSEIGKEDVNQVRNYLTEPMGKLGILCCNKKPIESAYIKRNSIYSSSEKKVILFITKEHLIEMLYIKERGEDPADLIMDMIEIFYMEYE